MRYVTYPDLDDPLTTGRMANQLFALCATVGYARKYDRQVLLPDTWQYKDFFPDIPREWFLPKETILELTRDEPEYSAPWNYSPVPEGVTVLRGYFQSPMFWYDLDPREILGYTEADQDIIALHWRQGDYHRFKSHHPILPSRYYESVVACNPGLPVTIFTDSPERLPTGLSFQYDLGPVDELEAFSAFRRAKVKAIGNSTWSWMAAWLSSGKVFRPPASKWFGPALKDHNAEQLFTGRAASWTMVEY